MEGKCHCGAVRFLVTEIPKKAIRCNCSYCIRRGWFTGYASAAEFKLLSGEDGLSSYQYGAKTGTNYYCKSCGIHTHMYGTYGGESGYAYNIACLEDVELESLEIEKINGKAFV